MIKLTDYPLLQQIDTQECDKLTGLADWTTVIVSQYSSGNNNASMPRRAKSSQIRRVGRLWNFGFGISFGIEI